MTLLAFPKYVKELEASGHWKLIINQLFDDWREQNDDLNRLLCVGTAIWYYLVFERELEPDTNLNREVLEKELKDVTQYGWINFADQWKFNMLFGYMIELYPYFWGDWDIMSAKALNMIEKACAQEPINPIPKICYYGSFSDHPLYKQSKRDAQVMVEKVLPESGTGIERYFRDMLLP